MTYKFSPSSLSLLKDCPRCFWLAQHKVWKRPAGIFPSLPSGMDKILKVHFDKFMEQGKLPPELCEGKAGKECSRMKLFDDKELLKVWQSNFKGIQFTDKKGNLLRGAVDNILKKGKKLIVLDYKTRGYALKEDTAKHYQNQLDIYNFLLRKNNYETEDYGFLLFYVPKEVTFTGEVIFDTSLVKMKVDVKNAEKIWKKALKLLNGEEPRENCDWCKYIHLVKDDEEVDKLKEKFRKMTEKAIKKTLCKKCNGVIVTSYQRSLISAAHGKRCWCLDEKSKRKKRK